MALRPPLHVVVPPAYLRFFSLYGTKYSVGYFAAYGCSAKYSVGYFAAYGYGAMYSVGYFAAYGYNDLPLSPCIQ